MHLECAMFAEVGKRGTLLEEPIFGKSKTVLSNIVKLAGSHCPQNRRGMIEARPSRPGMIQAASWLFIARISTSFISDWR